MKSSASDEKKDFRESSSSFAMLRREGRGKSFEGVPGVEGEKPRASVHPPLEELAAERLSEDMDERGDVSCRRGSDCEVVSDEEHLKTKRASSRKSKRRSHCL